MMNCFRFCFNVTFNLNLRRYTALVQAGAGRRVARARARHGHPCLGEPVQVDPIKPTLKAPGIKLLKLKYDISLSKFAFKFNLRRYIWAFTGDYTQHAAAAARTAEADAGGNPLGAKFNPWQYDETAAQ
jgi:hypothetical protein